MTDHLNSSVAAVPSEGLWLTSFGLAHPSVPKQENLNKYCDLLWLGQALNERTRLVQSSYFEKDGEAPCNEKR